MISLYEFDKSQKDLVNVTLVNGKASSPYPAGSKFTPSDNGYCIYADTNEFKWYQSAARSIGSIGLRDIRLNLEMPMSEQELYWFLTALYECGKDFTLEVPFDENTVKDVSEKVNLVARIREIADTDSKISTPVSLVDSLYSLVSEYASKAGAECSLKVIRRGDEEFSSLTGLNAVGNASFEDPCLGIIDCIPQGCDVSEIDVALVGKGITFDTGGYSLKPDKYMETMRTDKTACVYLCGALALALYQGLKKHVRVYLCCSENMVSGRGMLPGDILKYKNGVSVEINNTDAEGRLVLADGLLRAADDGARFILDMATLTGAAKIAVGRDMFSVLSLKEESATTLADAFDSCGEMYWLLPVSSYHRRFLSSRRADITNSGHGEGAPGASVAASFLSYFVPEDKPWVHIDLSSAYLPDGSPFLAAGPTGSTVLGISRWLLQ
ncbi:MAG: aminopeptidase PepB [Succinivibrio sp.]